LCDTIAPFITLSCLQELGHGANTNVNESLNQTILWFAPKNRTYCGSNSLRNRVGMAVSIHLVGYETFYVDLCRKLGLHVDARFQYCLNQAQCDRLKHLQYTMAAPYKEKRRAFYFEKMKGYFAALKEDEKQGKQYAPGVGFADSTQGQPKEIGDTIVRCKRCGGIAHKTANSKMCKFHRSRLHSSELVDGNYDNKQGLRKQGGARNKLTHTRNNVTDASHQDSVHDSTMFSETDRLGPKLSSASANLGMSAGNSWTTGTHSVFSIGFSDSSSSTDGSVSAGNELGMAMEVYQLSIVDSISCSTDLAEVDPGVRNILNDLLEEP